MITVEDLINNNDFQELYYELDENISSRELIADCGFDTPICATIDISSPETLAENLISFYDKIASVELINQTLLACSILAMIVQAMCEFKVKFNKYLVTPATVRAGSAQGLYKLLAKHTPKYNTCILINFRTDQDSSIFELGFSLKNSESKYLQAIDLYIQDSAGNHETIAKTLSINELTLDMIIKLINEFLNN